MSKTRGHYYARLPVVMLFAYPVLFYTTATLYPQALGGFLFLSILLLLFYHTTLGKTACAGLCLGYLILCIPSFLLTAPVLALAVFLHHQSLPVRRRIGHISLLTLCALLVVAPWTWRNYRVFDALIPVSTNAGLNLYLGNSPHTRPDSGVNVDRTELIAETESLNEVETDRHYRNRALEWIQHHPVDALRLYAGKVLHYFQFRNRLATETPHKWLTDALMFITWTPILLLFAIRPFYRKQLPFTALERTIWLLVVSNVFFSALFFTRIRFRLPFDLLMILANAIFVDKWLRMHRSPQFSPKNRIGRDFS